MKKVLALLLAGLLTVGLASVTAAEQGQGNDVLMLYDCEDTEGNGPNQSPWGQGPGVLDYEYFTQGETGLDVQAIFWPGLMMFHNLPQTYETESGFPDITEYDYVEFDMYSFYEMICDVELCLCRNVIAHHGSDCELFGMYVPANTFIHVRMPLSDFVTHSQENRDKYDETEGKYGVDGPEPSPELHYSGYALDRVERIRMQFTYCTDVDGNDLDDVEVVFDNFTATKNGAAHTHSGPEEPVELMTWEAYQQSRQNESHVPTPPPAQRLHGDVNNDSKVNASDALMALKAAVGKISLTPEEFAAADLDGNNAINASDALAILKISVGK